MSEQKKDPLLTVQEAVTEFFGDKLSNTAVLELWRAGHLPGLRVGRGRGKVLLYRSGLEKYIQKQQKENDR